MAARITIERILRDDDDASGHSVREWAIECEPGYVTIKSKGGGFLLMRAADIDTFTADLARAKDTANALTAEKSPT